MTLKKASIANFLLYIIVVFLVYLILWLLLVDLAHADCRTLVLPDGTVLVVCCDSRGNCVYN